MKFTESMPWNIEPIAEGNEKGIPFMARDEEEVKRLADSFFVRRTANFSTVKVYLRGEYQYTLNKEEVNL